MLVFQSIKVVTEKLREEIKHVFEYSGFFFFFFLNAVLIQSWLYISKQHLH